MPDVETPTKRAAKPSKPERTALHKVMLDPLDVGSEMRYVKSQLADLATAVEAKDWKQVEATSKDVRFVMHQLVSHAKAQQA